MNVMPVFRAEQPSTCWTYSVRMKKFANSDAAEQQPATLAPATVRMRKIENGISGSFARDSITRNAISSSDRDGEPEIVQPDPQPWFGRFETA